MSDPLLPEITDEDISRACRLLNLPDRAFHGTDGNDPRQVVLKDMECIDVAACPGSGKTTLLVAKLAILAEKWNHCTQGMCVLSHTNVARNEIETRLGNTSAGRKLLSYPHFIGTIHGFVNEFLALPWLRSKGIPVRMIDSVTCEARRWAKLAPGTQYFLGQKKMDASSVRISDATFGLSRKGGAFPCAKHTNTYKDLQRACQEAYNEGFHCYDDMFVWATELLDKVPRVAEIIRGRFPLLFIDEAQDNSETQSAILHRLFVVGNSPVIRQRFGDPNQAIFHSIEEQGATTDAFPDEAAKRSICNSYRFGQRIADLADSLGLEPYDLQGCGPRYPLNSGESNAPHTIFLFRPQNANNVIQAFGRLLLHTFSDFELRAGTFTAVGQRHQSKDGQNLNRFPEHVGHYWAAYEPNLASREPKPKTFPLFLHAGAAKADNIGEAFPCLEMIAEGFLRLADMAHGTTVLRRRHPHKHKHRYVLELLHAHRDVRDMYFDLVLIFAVKKAELTKETWDSRWRENVLRIAEAMAGASVTGDEVESFLAFDMRDTKGGSVAPPRCGNIYTYKQDNKEVRIKVGSIHSVKGETHTATLVLETFWRDNKGRHNLELLLPWLAKEKSGGKSVGPQQQARLKLHYVAMTRPTHLLCLAMSERCFSDDSDGVDDARVKKLEECGWRIVHVS